MGGIAVVTDSTADLPLELAEDLGLRVVPLTVSFGDEEYISRITITDEEFYDRLQRSDALPTTSQPAPAWFEEAYQDCADEGLDAVVSVHLSSELSGTCDVARQIARTAPLPVHVVDSRQVSGGLAFAALAAQRRADGGADVEEIVAAARGAADRTRTFVVVDTLDYLRRGGRLSGTQAFVGSMLRVKPLLAVNDGKVELEERSRTWGRALDRLTERVRDHADGRAVDVIVANAFAEDRAGELWSSLEAAIDIGSRLDVVVGPVVGTHTGPGSVGVAVLPED
ncbi:MAG: DegV family protein [Nitriliruptorales bacterium]|nr:DegV family protein [Nitriliruptorales bacterium]